jgi:hypothetical protein
VKAGFPSSPPGEGLKVPTPIFLFLFPRNTRAGIIDSISEPSLREAAVVADNGDISCWRNGWIDDVPQYWQPLGKRFTGKGFGDVRGVRFEDINGDGRDQHSSLR